MVHRCVHGPFTLPVTPIERGFLSPFGHIALSRKSLALPCPASLTNLTTVFVAALLLIHAALSEFKVHLECSTRNRDDASSVGGETLRKEVGFTVPEPAAQIRISSASSRPLQACRRICQRFVKHYEYLTGTSMIVVYGRC